MKPSYCSSSQNSYVTILICIRGFRDSMDRLTRAYVHPIMRPCKLWHTSVQNEVEIESFFFERWNWKFQVEFKGSKIQITRLIFQKFKDWSRNWKFEIWGFKNEIRNLKLKYKIQSSQIRIRRLNFKKSEVKIERVKLQIQFQNWEI